jgi:hypothetical protein
VLGRELADPNRDWDQPHLRMNNRREHQMNTKSITFTILMGLLTTITLAGSIIIIFGLFGPQGFIKPGLVIKPAGTFLVLVFAPIGGALWGWGIASLMKADVKPLIKTGALTWTIWLFIFFVITGVIGAFSSIDLPNDHYEYLVVFLPAAGLAAALPARVMIGKLGLDYLKKNIGINTGVAAALGFLVVSLILQLGFGWEVGRPVYGSHSMPTILQWCCLGAALAGGMAIGWVLAKSNEDEIAK